MFCLATVSCTFFSFFYEAVLGNVGTALNLCHGYTSAADGLKEVFRRHHMIGLLVFVTKFVEQNPPHSFGQIVLELRLTW